MNINYKVKFTELWYEVKILSFNNIKVKTNSYPQLNQIVIIPWPKFQYENLIKKR
jgi:hypothetical protein